MDSTPDSSQRGRSGNPVEHLSAIHGNFIPVSGPEAADSPSRLRRASPVRVRPRPAQRRQAEQGVHLHLSLTDGQMDKLTTAFSTPSPERRQPRRGTGQGNEISETIRADPFVNRGGGRDRLSSPDTRTSPPSRAPACGITHSPSHSPGKILADPGCGHGGRVDSRPFNSHTSSTIAERRQGTGPSPINTAAARKLPCPAQRLQALHRVQTSQVGADLRGGAPRPAALAKHDSLLAADGDTMGAISPSAYSDSDGTGASLVRVSPLRVNKSETGLTPQGHNVFQDYAEWMRAIGDAAGPSSTRGQVGSGSEQGDTASVKDTSRPSGAQDVFSPLTPYFQEADSRSMTKGRKVMVGHNGWLERTNQPGENKPPAPKKSNLLNAIKKMARDVADMADIRAARQAREEERSRRTTPLRISLDPREQSLLYCELEFILTSAVDSYISSQLNAGRLSADKYKKIADGWQDKGRPRVVGFRYDLETQLDLIRLHVAQFRFYGSRSGNPIAIAGVLDMMKGDARAMRIRTFCQPDSVVGKQLLDAQHLFNTLGCSEPRQVQLAEVIQFFQTVVEREKAFRAPRTTPELPAGSTRDTVQSGHNTSGSPRKRHANANRRPA